MSHKRKELSPVFPISNIYPVSDDLTYPPVVGIHEKEDNELKQIVYDTLINDLIPIKDLIQIILQYTLPFRSLCTTVAGPLPDDYPRTGLMDGPARKATFSYISYIIEMKQPESKESVCIIMEFGNRRARQLFRGHVTTIGDVLVEHPTCLALDHRNPNRLYVGGSNSISRMDRNEANKWTSKILAGSGVMGYNDGIPGNACFSSVEGLLTTYDGKELLVCDTDNNRIRSVSITDETLSTYGTVKTIIGNDLTENNDGFGTLASLCHLESIMYARSSPESTIIIICGNEDRSHGTSVRVYDPKTHQLSTLFQLPHELRTFVRLKDDMLIGTVGCGVCVLNLKTHSMVMLAGRDAYNDGYENGSSLEIARFSQLNAVCVENLSNGSESVASSGLEAPYVLVCDNIVNNGTIRKITLPPLHLFE